MDAEARQFLQWTDYIDVMDECTVGGRRVQALCGFHCYKVSEEALGVVSNKNDYVFAPAPKSNYRIEFALAHDHKKSLLHRRSQKQILLCEHRPKPNLLVLAPRCPSRRVASFVWPGYAVSGAGGSEWRGSGGLSAPYSVPVLFFPCCISTLVSVGPAATRVIRNRRWKKKKKHSMGCAVCWKERSLGSVFFFFKLENTRA